MSLRTENEASKEFVLSHFCEDYLGVTKNDINDHYVTVQVVTSGLDNNIIVSLLQSNEGDVNKATPIEDRQNEDPIVVELGNGEFTIIANTAYSRYAFVKINPNSATTGRVFIKILL